MTPALRLPWEWRLTVLSTPSAECPRAVPLERYESVEFGRAADVVIADPELSRRHARVTLLEGDEVLVEDLGSRNGTRVGRYRLRSEGRSQGPDAVILAGKTVLHVGRVSNHPGDPLELGDAALLEVARQLTGVQGAVLLTTTAPELGERLARRLAYADTTVWSLGWNAGGELELAVEHLPGGSWLLLTDPRHPRLGELVEAATRRGLRVVISSERPTEAQVRAVGESHVVVVPPMGDRRDELYRRLRVGLARAGCAIPFRPTALHRLLMAGWDERLLALRLERLIRCWEFEPSLAAFNSDHVRAALRSPAAGELPRRRHVVPVDLEVVKRELEEGLTVAELAERHDRSRKQVYRWIELLGGGEGRAKGLRSTSEPTP
jgi:hypothetical protein